MERKSLAIVISLAKSHIHYCKALIVSLKHYDINNQIIILKDGDFNINSFERYRNVKVVSTRSINTCHDFKLTGLLTKINICFLPEIGLKYDYYLHMDADSIVTSSDFKDKLNNLKDDFYILQGKAINYQDDTLASQFNNYAFNPTTFDDIKFNLEDLWYFSSGHFIMNYKLIQPLIEYLKQYRSELNTGFSKQTRFKFGDQGFFNFVVNILYGQNMIIVKALNCGIYGKDNENLHQKLTLNAIKEKVNTDVDFIHYTGPSRKPFLKAHNFGTVLVFYSKQFYNYKLGFYFGNIVRIIKHYYIFVKKRISLKLQKLFKA